MLDSQQLRAHLEAGIAELTEDVERLRAALAALDAASEGPSRTPRAPRQDAPVAEVVPSGALTRLLAEHDGLTTADLAEATGGNAEQILRRLKDLEAEGAVHRSGNRRSTRWHTGEGSGRADEAAPAEAATPDQEAAPAASAPPDEEAPAEAATADHPSPLGGDDDAPPSEDDEPARDRAPADSAAAGSDAD